MQNLFVYGTLLSSEIVKKLTGESFTSKKAILYDFKRYGVKKCDYPAITPITRGKTLGQILMNISDSSLKIIEFFEGNEYERREVMVSAEGKEIAAVTFVWKSGIDLLDDGKWDFKHFQENFLSVYLEEIVPETVSAYRNNLDLF